MIDTYIDMHKLYLNVYILYSLLALNMDYGPVVEIVSTTCCSL